MLRPALSEDDDPKLDFELRSWRELESIRTDWADLAARAECPNVFYDPVFAVNAAKALGVEHVLKAALFWRGQGSTRRLSGFLPLITRRRWIVTPPNLEVWTNPYAPASHPLTEPGVAEVLGRTLVQGLADTANLPRILMMPNLVLDSAFAIDLLGAGAPLFVHNGYQKPIARTELDGAGYLSHAVRPKRQKEWKRRRSHLEAKGDLQFRVLRDPSELTQAGERFIALEASGWKGRRGTALENSAAGAALFRSVVADMAGDGRLRIAELSLDGKTIVSFVILCSPGHYWLWKTTFDETHAKQSPGHMALVDVIGAMLDETPGATIDSCAVEADHFSGRVLREFVAMGDVLLSTRPRPNIIFRTANVLEAVRGSVRTARNRIRS
ncbi:MAG: GNAT family N-acetyltransferase [Pseudomonadota bacterium]